MPFASDRAALRHLVDTITAHEFHDLDPQSRAALDAACTHMLSPDPALARLRRSLCETAAALNRLTALPGCTTDEVQRARAILRETAQ